MTAPDLGRCRCSGQDGPDHEHSDFEPFPCADCSCPSHRRLETADSLTLGGAETPAQPSDRGPAITITKTMDFATQRVTQAQEWLDQILAGIHETAPRDPDDPLAVCGLADILEQANTVGIDPYDALALAIRRLQDACRPGPRRARDVLRRIRPR